ncbi:MAG: ribonuclease domain-containing protein [Erysipelotrichaceae bacterium]
MDKKFIKKLFRVILTIAVLFTALWAKEYFFNNTDNNNSNIDTEITLQQDKYYYDKENVALYIHTYNQLPANYVTKQQAQDAGWSGGSVEKYLPDMAIGGDVFANFEENLPVKDGRIYYECDIDTHNQDSRGAKRIVFSNDGLIYYTDDHYETFELLYGEQ